MPGSLCFSASSTKFHTEIFAIKLLSSRHLTNYYCVKFSQISCVSLMASFHCVVAFVFCCRKQTAPHSQLLSITACCETTIKNNVIKGECQTTFSLSLSGVMWYLDRSSKLQSQPQHASYCLCEIFDRLTVLRRAVCQLDITRDDTLKVVVQFRSEPALLMLSLSTETVAYCNWDMYSLFIVDLSLI